MSSEPRELSRAIRLLGGTGYGRLSATVRALPFVTLARHIVAGDSVLMLLHGGHGYHRACDGSVVAYGADNIGSGTEDVWSVQLVGTAHCVEPGDRERERLGPLPRSADGAPFAPAYLRMHPRLTTVHSLHGVPVPGSGRSW